MRFVFQSKDLTVSECSFGGWVGVAGRRVGAGRGGGGGEEGREDIVTFD